MTNLARPRTPQEWLQLHREHLNRRGGEEFEQLVLPADEAVGCAEQYVVVCPCGARRLSDEKLEL